jgi:replication initiator protein RepSA
MTWPPDLIAGIVERAGRPDFARFEAQVRSSNYCARPVRLRGHVETCDEGGRRRVWSTDSEPDGILRKACGNRREVVCPSCAERYRQDAYHLIAAGLRGGKSVPDTIVEHPAVFVTLTAPSFGIVHTRRRGSDGQAFRCRPRRDADVCPHGIRMSCGQVHDDDDPCLGQPLCPECFDHRGAVVWNNALSELWRRTSIYLPRMLARLTGMTQKRLGRLVRVAYVKVAEYQQRGLVHLHVVIRLDRAMPKYRADEIKPPPPRFTAGLLEDAIGATAREVHAPLADELPGERVGWGDELDVRHLDAHERSRVAGYLAKYATKSTEQAGGVLHRVGEHELDGLAVSDHVRAYLRAAFALADDPALAGRRYGRYAHALGYRGHCLTKSRRYSTTFKAIREARERHVDEQLLKRSPDRAQRELAQIAKSERIASFRYVGQGHLTAADALLAASAAARAREERRAAREELLEAPRAQLTVVGRAGRWPTGESRAINAREAVWGD